MNNKDKIAVKNILEQIIKIKRKFNDIIKFLYIIF